MEPPDDLSDGEYTSANDITPSHAIEALQQSVLPKKQQKKVNQQHLEQPSSYLASLNPAQKEAVTASTEGGLQILAGPGSGKTAVLTRRVAYLIQHQGIDPERLVVVTFTNKAANEMKVRLSKILGPKETERVVMGTFHSTCVRYLRKYAKLVNLGSNFIIADRDDCLAMIKRILATLELPEELRRGMKPPTWLEHISKCKSRMVSPMQYRAEKTGGYDSSKHEWIATVFEAYEDELAKANSLDFDDLLLRGHELFTNHPRVVARIQSVLIDEFQDTNSVQYDLVKLIARPSGSLTIVGDPDQSIYGWRNAEVENLDKMVKEFSPCRQIFLEQNYRSTGAILGAALAVVRQDTKRINKSLHSSHPSGSSVVLHPAAEAQTEAIFIASTIRHLVAHLGGLVTYNDFAILLRYGALSRAIEVGLQKAGIPSRMVGGHKFFERAEVKDVLSYLQLLSNPSYTPALQRIINVPRRSLGDKAVKSIMEYAKSKSITAFEVCVKIANGFGRVGVTPAQMKAIKNFVEIVRDGRKKADEGVDVTDLIDFITDRTSYQAYLEKTQGPDAQDRWENVKELKSYAALVAEENPADVELKTEMELEEVDIPGGQSAEAKKEEEDDDFDGDDSGFGEGEIEVPLSSQSAVSGKTTPLEVFLATSMLATDIETQDAKNDKTSDKVTISTCHGAKGLEWPIVFVPACEDGTYPFFRCTEPNEIDEERRLLYVAITRAQGFCFISYSNARMAAGQMQKKSVTPFLSTVSQTYPTLFVNKLTKVSKKTREEMAKVLGRPAPSEDEASERIAKLALEPAIPEPVLPTKSTFSGGGGFNGGSFSNQGRWSNNQIKSQPVPTGGGGFQSARAMVGPSSSQPVAKPFRPANLSAMPSASQPVASSAKAFKPLRPASSQPASTSVGNATPDPPAAKPGLPPRYLAPRQPEPTASSSQYAPQLAPYSSASSGPPPTVETRASMIRDAVLVNPVLTAPTKNPSTQRDLLSSFQQAENKHLNEYRGGTTSTPAEPSQIGSTKTVDLTMSSDDLPPPSAIGPKTKRPPMSPMKTRKRSKK